MRLNPRKQRPANDITWHPRLSAIPFILKHNFHLISTDPKMSKMFQQKPTAIYRKNKSLSDYLLKSLLQLVTTLF